MLKSPLLVIILVVFFTPLFLFSQSGPGGVGDSSTNGLWLKVDDLNLANGQDVSYWQDASGNNNDANQIVNTAQPSFQSISSFNNYPSISFNGSSDWLKVDDSDILDGSSSISFFTVLKPRGLGTSNAVQTILSKRQAYNTNSSNYSYTFFFYNDKLTNDIVTGNNRYASTSSFSNNNNYILSFDFDGSRSASSRSSMSSNGNVLLSANESSTTLYNSSAPLTIGVLNVGDGRFANSEISEIIHYNYKLNEAETVVVNNYLSAKYNIALGSNDFYTQDNTASGNFDFDVAGIGQASDGSNHTDSQGTGIVKINTPSALSNGDYLFWGEETKDPLYALVTNPSDYTKRLNSKWRVSKVGDLGTVTVSFDITDIAAAIACNTLQMAVDNDSDFSSPTLYNLTISGTTATATGVLFSDADYFSLKYVDEIVWDGATFFNGSSVLNAPSNADSCLKLTVKSGSIAILTADAHVREIEVEPGAVLQVNNGVLLEVENGVVNDGTIDLLAEAQLIQNHTGSSLNSGSGDFKIRQEGTYNLYNYNYWSAPVSRSGNWQVGYLETETGPIGFTTAYDANPSSSPMQLSNYWLYTFNEVANNYYGWNQITTTTAVNPGIGYSMKGSGNIPPAPLTPSDQEYVFKGTANDGDYSIIAAPGNEILLGNPYPSALSASQFINDNLAVINGTLYFYEHFSSNSTHILADYQGGYATYNLLASLVAPAAAINGGTPSKGAPKDNIPVAQGFFITVDTGGAIVFNNNQRVYARESLSESTFFRSAQEAVTDNRVKFWIKFKDIQNNESTIALGYDANASVAFDKGYDSNMYNDLPNELYWPITDHKLSIQGLNSFDVSAEIPLGINISNSGDYTFEISETLNFPSNETIYLKDNQTNTFYDIQSNPISLNLTSGQDESRFSIVYQNSESLSTTDFDTHGVSLFYNVEKEALVFEALDNLNSIKDLNIYNLLGQKVKSLNAIESREVDLSFLNSGIFIAEIIQNSGQKLKLKFIKP